MTLIDALQSDPTTWILVIGLLGLIVGSFLNVVIHRLPIMMHREWRGQCKELLATPATGDQPSGRFDLVYPRSHCPRCGHPIGALQNIPILSYLLQLGRCRACKQGISLRYPLLELVSAVAAAVVAWKFGFGWQATGGVMLTWALISMSGIDFDHHLLPDSITLPFMWLGLGFNLFAVYTDLQSSVIGAMAGYLSLWLVYVVFKRLTGKEGMGHGDFKLLALLGAWMGWQYLPLIIVLSSVVGAVVGTLLIVFTSRDKGSPIPFGPYLAMAGWVAFMWGGDIIDLYLGLLGGA